MSQTQGFCSTFWRTNRYLLRINKYCVCLTGLSQKKTKSSFFPLSLYFLHLHMLKQYQIKEAKAQTWSFQLPKDFFFFFFSILVEEPALQSAVVMRMDQYSTGRRGVRQYNRSEAPRLRWTEELHRRFVEAIDCLGGGKSKFRVRISSIFFQKRQQLSTITTVKDSVCCRSSLPLSLSLGPIIFQYIIKEHLIFESFRRINY